jgi:GMP synthase-like glutamine amidotransferase
MILLVSVCTDNLSELEFVKPVENIVRHLNLVFLKKNYLNLNQHDLDRAEKIVICGSALKDFEYLKKVDRFGWVKRFERPILGICAGTQILARVFCNSLIERTRIGPFRVTVTQENKLTSKREFDAYFLNSKAAKITKNFKTIAVSGGLECMMKHEDKEIYGCLFHPEVLNPEIIVNFLSSI